MQVDLNADLGEGCGQDEQILDYVTSANIACGWHAGDADTMYQCVRWAMERNVAIGAHPSFPDRENFGRTEMNLSHETIFSGVLYQIGALQAIARAAGATVRHVKPHGALYNQAARDAGLAQAVVNAIKAADPALVVVGLAGGELVRAARAAGLAAWDEVFADRGYRADGSLVPRGTPGAMIEDEDAAVMQTLHMVQENAVIAQDGARVAMRADTVCLHGDSAHAVAFARLIRQRLEGQGIQVCPAR